MLDNIYTELCLNAHKCMYRNGNWASHNPHHARRDEIHTCLTASELPVIPATPVISWDPLPISLTLTPINWVSRWRPCDLEFIRHKLGHVINKPPIAVGIYTKSILCRGDIPHRYYWIMCVSMYSIETMRGSCCMIYNVWRYPLQGGLLGSNLICRLIHGNVARPLA